MSVSKVINDIDTTVKKLRNIIGNSCLLSQIYNGNYECFSKYASAMDMVEDMLIALKDIISVKYKLHFYSYYISVSQILYIIRDQIISLTASFGLYEIRTKFLEENSIKKFNEFRNYVNHPSNIINSPEGIKAVHINRIASSLEKVEIHAYTREKNDFIIKTIDINDMVFNLLTSMYEYFYFIFNTIKRDNEVLERSSQLDSILVEAIQKRSLSNFKAFVNNYKQELIRLSGSSEDSYEFDSIDTFVDKFIKDSYISKVLEHYIFDNLLVKYLSFDIQEEYKTKWFDNKHTINFEDNMYSYYVGKLISTDDYLFSIARKYIMDFYDKKQFKNEKIKKSIQKLLNEDPRLTIGLVEFIFGHSSDL